jgi:murein DD-endopeptidase MepM/ murein hydrolase activator NlpD
LLLKNPWSVTLGGVFVLALMLGSFPAARGAAATSDQIQRQRSQINATHERLHQKRQQLNLEELRERDYKRQLSESSASIAVVKTRLLDLQGRIQTTTGDEERERRELSIALSELRTQRDAYRRRLVEMYEHPPERYWTVLLGSTSFVDFVERWHDLRYVVAADQQEVRTRDAVVQQVDAAQVAIAANLVRLQTDQQEQMHLNDQLGALVQERTNLVAMAEQQRSSVAGEVQHLEEISAQEEAELEQLVRAQEAELERQRAGQHLASAPVPPSTGQMLWPVSGPITSPFGMRLNPFGGGNTEFHPGIDIAVPVGTSVAAAAAGRVIIAGWVSGYGNYVAVDHGGGISTGYGHLSQIFVSVGQDVQRGQVIGVSGNTGRSTGPHLIFEVRRNGSPVDPTPYL